MPQAVGDPQTLEGRGTGMADGLDAAVPETDAPSKDETRQADGADMPVSSTRHEGDEDAGGEEAERRDSDQQRVRGTIPCRMVLPQGDADGEGQGADLRGDGPLAHGGGDADSGEDEPSDVADVRDEAPAATTPADLGSALRAALDGGPARPGSAAGQQGGSGVPASYVQAVRSAIAPGFYREAAGVGGTGTTLVAVEIRRDGSVLSARVEKSSGNPQLDAASLAAAQGARFPPLPVTMNRAALTIHIPLRVR